VDAEMLSDSELDRRLHQLNPISLAALDDTSVVAALASMEHDLEFQSDEPPSQRRIARPDLRQRWTRLGVATATVAAASLLGIETLGGAGVAALPLAVSPAAAAQLSEVAHAAAGQRYPDTTQLEYESEKYELAADPAVGGVTVGFSSAVTIQSWGRKRTRVTGDGITFNTPQNKANYQANESAFDAEMATTFADLVGAPSAQDPTATGLQSDDLLTDEKQGNLTAIQAEVFNGAENPSGPRALIADLTTAFSADPSYLFGSLTSILRDSTNAQLRATAYEALKYVPGTTVMGNVKDQLGRPGIEISFAGTTTRPSETQAPIYTMIVSPATGYLLESDDTKETPQQGTVIQREIVLQRGIVNSDTELPGGASQPITAETRTEDVANGTVSSTPPAGAQTTTTASSTPSASTTPASTTTAPPPTTTTTPPTTTSPATTTNSQS